MLEKKLTETKMKSNLKIKNSSFFDAFCKSQVARDPEMLESLQQLAEIMDSWGKSSARAAAANSNK